MEWTKFDWFFLGLMIGYLWYPLWALGKKIVHEAKVAKNEWRNPDRD